MSANGDKGMSLGANVNIKRVAPKDAENKADIQRKTAANPLKISESDNSVRRADKTRNNMCFDGFAPVCDDESRLLVLGSFPSVKSREIGFYYGNARNRFWKTVCGAFGENVPDKISDKILFLKRRKIALWDVASRSDLKGSSDSDLTCGEFDISDIASLIKRSRFEKIIFNGKKAAALFNANFSADIPAVCLPSTSPANVSFDQSLWIKELQFLM